MSLQCDLIPSAGFLCPKIRKFAIKFLLYPRRSLSSRLQCRSLMTSWWAIRRATLYLIGSETSFFPETFFRFRVRYEAIPFSSVEPGLFKISLIGLSLGKIQDCLV